MRLSDLKTGEKGVIVKVLGHGGFRKRIVEMGFIRGKSIEVILNAPLKDPIKYKVMGYEVSLRRQEAELIEVLTEQDAENWLKEQEIIHNQPISEEEEITEDELRDIALKQRRTINVALVGNPNSGKTTLFNTASGGHERVGNYSGVTVDAKEGSFNFQGYHFKIVDLPGTYSLSVYSPEELYVRRHIVNEMPDVIINVVDVSNLERNLYLTTQLIDMNVRMVVALNMYDELEKSGNKLDYLSLSQLLGVPMIPTISKKNWGIDNLFHVIINLYEGADYIDENGNIDPEIYKSLKDWHETEADHNHDPQMEDYAHESENKHHKYNKVYRHIHINHGPLLEEAINNVKSIIAENENIRAKFSTRFLAIKLLEKDSEVEEIIKNLPNGSAILHERDKMAEHIQKTIKEDSESAIIDAKYGFIDGALKEVYTDNHIEKKEYTKLIDRIVTHKIWGYPIFLAILFLMFQLTFSLGQYPMDWIEKLVDWTNIFVHSHMADGPFKDLLTDGVITGVGAVLVFLPNILILYLCISFLEDTGYMARAAFIMDKIMHKMGLHGKSFIPLIMGFGCNVPAIMASRTIESRKSRLITILINPLMSCSARLPVYLVLVGAFFPNYKGLILFGLYLTGILLAALMSRIFSKFMIKGEDLPFVMELPPYRMPTAKSILRHTWDKGKQYLRKMGGVILIASIVIWFLGYFPQNPHYDTMAEQQENSYIGKIGKAIEPAIKPLGFDWKLGIGLLSGIGAKELVVSSLSVIYAGGEEDSVNLGSRIPITPLVALSYMLFVLIYFPCVATIAAIKHETGKWKYAIFTMFYTTALAWIVSFAVYQIGSLLL
ncbi:ferrous iron transport protein B [Bacteroidales bacterium OttesenSCG-928-B11]|nr:ferrous iron transport protein B [Bacteroidales bacterium OttesenSCG-928-E04]MDL2308780.1 ferrous iron transport protein B [Bacteroidales bacterium OttesenSCG-928-C03]MDL2311980.1 ferrous iron transport protein B [Bacteroidales bacterium OttesenSCG-928-B11]